MKPETDGSCGGGGGTVRFLVLTADDCQVLW
jgi:hypothetical protein